ncbi:hypothetical protein NA78x_003031 [Anatilimnocola sp. NA78]|uniref:hypothetical protein n=1 Tax=Anatilimnocola sp. NA78 TaxID=3415683 RepID=UPI003CE45021
MAKKKAAPKPKTTAKKTAKGAATGKSELPNARCVRVRMYCQGLGDCFLLTFPRKRGGRDFQMLIDCGVILGTPSAGERMQQVVGDIFTTTNGVIDLLVGTHEHWDHISGFEQAKEQFKKFDIKQTWLAWTENPKDKLANELREEREEKKKKLALALDHFRRLGLHETDGPARQTHFQLAGLASFFGIDLAAAAQEGIGKTAEAMEFLRKTEAQFLKPFEVPPALDISADIDIFVLGPPTDKKLLKKDLPTKKGKEVYEEHEAHAFTSLVGLDAPDETGRQESQPFDNRMGMPLRSAMSDPYFVQMYDNGLDEHPAAWRRIDDIGMFAATDLALKLDADTNNTSLVLAIRLPNGKVLLFPGDAQVGNWESWHALEKHDKRATMPELLANTVIYKTGHHGSHNATLSDLGLEMMTSTDLTALLPVDEDVAHNNKGWRRMPFIPLMNELHRRTGGRIMRVDHERKHPATDMKGGSKRNWTLSEAKFTSEPIRSLYLETIVEWK